jgi:hypothetical protein
LLAAIVGNIQIARLDARHRVHAHHIAVRRHLDLEYFGAHIRHHLGRRGRRDILPNLDYPDAGEDIVLRLRCH